MYCFFFYLVGGYVLLQMFDASNFTVDKKGSEGSSNFLMVGTLTIGRARGPSLVVFHLAMEGTLSFYDR